MNGFLQRLNSPPDLPPSQRSDDGRSLRFFARGAMALLAFTVLSSASAFSYVDNHHDRTASGGGGSEAAHYSGRQVEKTDTQAKAVGTIDEESGGLDGDIWAGLSSGEAAKLIRALPDSYDSIAQRTLAQRTLTSATQGPSGGFEDFTAARIEKLSSMGALSEAAALFNTVPYKLRTPSLTEKGIETMLYAGQPDAACLEIYAQEESLSASLSQKGRIACAIYTGQTEAARELVTRLPENKRQDAFAVLAQHAAGMDGDVPALNEKITQDAFAWFLWLKTMGAKQSIDLSALNSRLVASIALSPVVEQKQRLEAAVRAARKGMIDSGIIESVFVSQPMKPETVKSRADSLRKNDNIKPSGANMALLYRASALSDEKASKAALVERGLKLSGPMYSSLALPYADPLSTLPVDSSHISLAFSASFLLYISGFYDNAAQWRELLKAQGGQNNEYLPYVLVAENPVKSDAPDLSGWSQALAEKDPSGADRRIQRIFSALRPFGYAMENVSAETVEEKKPLPETLERLKRISGKGHKAERILLALDVLDGTGPDKVDPELLEPMLDALVKAELDQEARMIAIEVIAANLETKTVE